MAGGEQLHRIADAARAIPRSFVEDAAETIAESIRERLTEATGGDDSLSHAPAELSVDTKVTGGGTVEGTVSAEGGGGQWVWLEEGTEPHRIGSGLHPGTSGKSVWSGGLSRELRSLSHDMENRFDEMMRGG